MYFTLSWRNIWRNKRRTLIAAASVAFAVMVAVMMRSAQLGSYAYMIHSSAKLFTGYLQLQGKGYWDDRSIDKSMIVSETQMQKISTIPHVTSVTPRLETFSLVSHGLVTKVGQIIGIDPGLEDQMTGLRQRVAQGAYLPQNSSGLLIARGLAEMLKVSVGDSVVLYGQGYHGQIAADRLPVIGIVKLPFPALNNGLVYLTLSKAQEVFSAPGRITSTAIMIDNVKHLSAVKQAMHKMVNNKYDLMTWDEMMPELHQSIQLDNASGIIMLIILYIVIVFGVFGTVMMMTSERTREFGILISVGMKRVKLATVTTLETIYLALLGAFIGTLLSLPMVYYLHAHPIRFTGDAAKAYEALGIEPLFNFSTDPTIVFNQALVVLLIALATALYPLLFVNRIQPAKALKG